MLQFSSISEFFAMGGYGFYVWISYGGFVVAMAAVLVASVSKRKNTLQNIQKKQRRDKKLSKLKNGSEVNESST